MHSSTHYDFLSSFRVDINVCLSPNDSDQCQGCKSDVNRVCVRALISIFLSGFRVDINVCFSQIPKIMFNIFRVYIFDGITVCVRMQNVCMLNLKSYE